MFIKKNNVYQEKSYVFQSDKQSFDKLCFSLDNYVYLDKHSFFLDKLSSSFDKQFFFDKHSFSRKT